MIEISNRDPFEMTLPERGAEREQLEQALRTNRHEQEGLRASLVASRMPPAVRAEREGRVEALGTEEQILAGRIGDLERPDSHTNWHMRHQQSHQRARVRRADDR